MSVLLLMDVASRTLPKGPMTTRYVRRAFRTGVEELGSEYIGASAAGLETAMEISWLRCSWKRRVAVTASSAMRFFRMTFEDITTIVAMAASSSPATASDASTSTKVKPRCRRANGAERTTWGSLMERSGRR